MQNQQPDDCCCVTTKQHRESSVLTVTNVTEDMVMHALPLHAALAWELLCGSHHMPDLHHDTCSRHCGLSIPMGCRTQDEAAGQPVTVWEVLVQQYMHLVT